jgi:tryptophanyl-tRNA synthetase
MDINVADATEHRATKARPRVFSGMQPSGEFQLGNYLGALKNWVLGQEEKENFFCVVDLHSLTVPQDPEDLRARTRAVAAIYLAAGIDPDKSVLFVQSHVSAHAEGCWLLNCVTPLGWLNKMTQFKDKSARQESVQTGLLDYPVLMAADILLYDADEVPVGEDQKQHVELARNIAERFNHVYGPTFVVPTPMIAKVGARIMGLDNPQVKMSKSYAHIRGHAVRVLDDPAEIERSFKRAVTDAGNEIRFSEDPEKAGVNNLLSIYKVVTQKSEEEVERDFADARGYGDLKKRVAEVVIAELTPVRERYEELMRDPAELDRLLIRGADQARAIAEPKLREMMEKMGLVVLKR